MARGFSELLTMPLVAPAKTLGNEILYELTQKFFPLVAKKLLGLGVDERDLAEGIHNDHGVGSGFEQGSKFIFGPWSFARVSRLGLATQGGRGP
jgi:hypothetical protein